MVFLIGALVTDVDDGVLSLSRNIRDPKESLLSCLTLDTCLLGGKAEEASSVDFVLSDFLSAVLLNLSFDPFVVSSLVLRRSLSTDCFLFELVSSSSLSSLESSSDEVSRVDFDLLLTFLAPDFRE